jgi:hypothetical protein
MEFYVYSLREYNKELILGNKILKFASIIGWYM